MSNEELQEEIKITQDQLDHCNALRNYASIPVGQVKVRLLSYLHELQKQTEASKEQLRQIAIFDETHY